MIWFFLVYIWFVAGMTTVALLPVEMRLAGNLLVILAWPLVVLVMGLYFLWEWLVVPEYGG